MKLVIPLHFISWKKTPNDAVTPQCRSQFTPKMKANAVPRLLSSLVWIDSGIVVSLYRSESFFMRWNEREWQVSWNPWSALVCGNQWASVVRATDRKSLHLKQYAAWKQDGRRQQVSDQRHAIAGATSFFYGPSPCMRTASVLQMICCSTDSADWVKNICSALVLLFSI